MKKTFFTCFTIFALVLISYGSRISPFEIGNNAPIYENEDGYSDWGTIHNPYYDMQVRYKLEKQEGDIGYFKAQFRIDFENRSSCKTARCLGYLVCFGYPNLDGKEYSYLHYKIYNSYTQIYTMPDLLQIKMSFPDGSKRILKKDGFYFKTKDSDQETFAVWLFDNSVDLMLEGFPFICKNFIESKAVILK